MAEGCDSPMDWSFAAVKADLSIVAGKVGFSDGPGDTKHILKEVSEVKAGTVWGLLPKTSNTGKSNGVAQGRDSDYSDGPGDTKHILKGDSEVKTGTVWGPLLKISNTGKSNAHGMAQGRDLDYSDGAGDTQYINLKDITKDGFFRLLAERLGAHWEPIATFLGISSDNITALKKEHSDPDEQIFQMLTAWQKNLADSDNMVQLLVNALEQGGRKDLAKDLQNGKWKKPVEPVVPTTSSGKPHGTPTIEEKRLRKVSEKLSGDMERLATELGVASERVDKIKDKNRKVAEQTFQMFRYWQCNTPGISHLDELVTALKAVGRRDIARDIENGTL